MSGARLLLVNSQGADEFSGGAEHYVAQLAEGFGARGYDVEILSAFPSHARGRRVTIVHDSDWRTSSWSLRVGIETTSPTWFR